MHAVPSKIAGGAVQWVVELRMLWHGVLLLLHHGLVRWRKMKLLLLLLLLLLCLSCVVSWAGPADHSRAEPTFSRYVLR
jgi:hypothetical protein